MSIEYSFIILTFNEEEHLPRLLNSIAGLAAETFILDSGSIDNTINICRQYKLIYANHPFENHPKQWNIALNTFSIKTPWVIGLDADQVVTPELYHMLESFQDKNFQNINGIYFNRKNIFKGKWIKHGGYYPKYLLKMFRHTVGHSDLNENMDHRFLVPGKTAIWKNGHLIEENLKENSVSFWIEKHNRYSDLLAIEEIERIQYLRQFSTKGKFWGSPNERNAWQKQLWWKLPLYIRPILYFSYRIFIQRGILDGKTGIIYHFLQGFWFRLIVDVKIEEKMKELKEITVPLTLEKPKQHPRIKFAVTFSILFIFFYTGNLAFIGLTNIGGFYVQNLDEHFNYIKIWREFDIYATAKIIKTLGYEVYTDNYRLHVQGRAGFRIVYSCLGYGILSLFSAFVAAFPKSIKKKISFLCVGLLGFQILNIIRLTLIALYWKPTSLFFNLDAHALFNYVIYSLLVFSTYLWLNPTHKKIAC